MVKSGETNKMPTTLIDYPRLILDFDVKLYTKKQDFVTNPDRFGIKSYEPRIICRNSSPPLYVLKHFFYHAGIAENDIKFLFLKFLVEAGLPM